MATTWQDVAARLEPELLGLPQPSNYHVGRRSGRPGLPDNILLFHRHTLDTELGPICHNRFVLILALAGSGRIHVDNCGHHLQPGRAMLLFPFQLHHYMGIQPNLRWLFITFECRESHAWIKLFNRPADLHPDHDIILQRMMGYFIDDRLVGAERLTLALALFLSELCDRAVSTTLAGSSNPDLSRVDVLERLNRILYERIDETMRIADLAKELELSPSHLRFVIRRSLGLSLGQYILRVRLHQSRILLSDPSLRVTDVARKCGFGSLPSFSRAYRRLMGSPPRDSRRLPAP